MIKFRLDDPDRLQDVEPYGEVTHYGGNRYAIDLNDPEDIDIFETVLLTDAYGLPHWEDPEIAPEDEPDMSLLIRPVH